VQLLMPDSGLECAWFGPGCGEFRGEKGKPKKKIVGSVEKDLVGFSGGTGAHLS